MRKLFYVIILFVSVFAFNGYGQDMFLEDNPDLIYTKIRINLGGGISRRFGRVSESMPEDLVEYVEGLRYGKNFGGDISYFFNKKYGLGIRCCYFLASNSLDSVLVIDTLGNPINGPIEDKISIWFLGPMFIYRLHLFKNIVELTVSAEAGILSYYDDAEVVNIPMDIRAQTFGMGGSLGLDVFLHKNFALGTALRYIVGNTAVLEINGEEVEFAENEELQRLDFNIGLKICL